MYNNMINKIWKENIIIVKENDSSLVDQVWTGSTIILEAEDGMLTNISNAMNAGVEQFKKLFNVSADFAKGAYNNASEAINKSFFSDDGNIASDFFNKIKQFHIHTGMDQGFPYFKVDTTNDLIHKMLDYIKNAHHDIYEKIMKLWESLKEFVSGAVKSETDNTGLYGVSLFIIGILCLIVDYMINSGTKSESFKIYGFKNYIKEDGGVVSNLFTSIKETFANLWKSVTGGLSSLGEIITSRPLSIFGAGCAITGMALIYKSVDKYGFQF